MNIFAILRNLLAIVGLVALVAGGIAYSRVQGVLSQLDPGAREMFARVAAVYMETLDPGMAAVKTIAVKEGLSADDVMESLQSLAVENNMFFAGESPFYKQVEAVTGQPFRFVSFFSFCDAMVGVSMIDHNTAYSAFMPCRIALVEDTSGRLWLHMMDLDLFIHGGKPLPAEVREGAIKVRDALEKMLHGAAEGAF
jgi:uncharacterized protein (DUF302 family)